MNKLNLFDSFEFYRELGTQYLFFEDDKKPRYHTLVSILSPTLKDSIGFLKGNQDIVFRFLQNMQIDKYQTYITYPNKHHREVLDNTMIESIVNSVEVTNNIDHLNVIINNPKSKKDMLRGRNVLVDINYTLEKILTNPDDNRTAKLKRPDIIHEITSSLEKARGAVGPEYRKVLIIPVNQWVNFEDYKKPNTFLKTSDNLIAHIYNHLEEDPHGAFMFDGWTVLLVNFNEIMILDMAHYLNELKSVSASKDRKLDTLQSYIKYFMKMCKSKSNEDKIAPEDTKDYSINKNLPEITKRSKAQLATEKILDTAGIDKSTASDERVEEIEKLVEKKIEETGDLKGVDISKIKVEDNAQALDMLKDAVAATLSKKSRDSYARNRMLKEKYTTQGLISKSGEKLTFAELPKSIAPVAIQRTNLDHLALLNDDMKSLAMPNMSKTYNEEFYKQDLLAIINHFAQCDPAMYPVSDIVEEDISDELNRLLRYTVTLEDTNRKRFILKFLLPKWYQDQYLFLNGALKYVNYQKIPFPITKISETTVQIGTNYNKIFINRIGTKAAPKTSKLIKYLGTIVDPKIKVNRGDATKASESVMTTIEYDELCKNYNEVTIDSTRFILDLIRAMNEIGIHESMMKVDLVDMTLIPVAISGTTKYYLDTKQNEVFDNKGISHGQLCDFIITILNNYKKTDVLGDVTSGTKYNYSAAEVMNETVPVIVFASAMAHGGLIEVLDIAKIKHEFFPSKRSVQIDKLNQGTVKFADGVLVYDRYPYENSLLMNGLSTLPTEEYNLLDFSNKETFIDIFDMLYNRRNLVEAVENFRQLFVDPITYQINLRLNLPTEIIRLVLYGNDLLADNHFISDVSYSASRIRKNEIIMVYLYKVLSTQYGKYRINPDSVRFTIPEDAVIKEILESRLTDEYSRLNPVLAVENDQEIKAKGPFGLNVDQAYTLDKRAFHPTMLGIIGSASAPSGEVGVKRHLTMNPNIIDARGFVDVSANPEKLTGSQLLTPGEMMSVLANESSDATRAAMSVNQAKQIVPTRRSSPDIISYGMERVVPYINNAFSYAAKQDGKVVDISENIMIVQYVDGTYDDIDLRANPVKHSNSAKYTVSRREHNLKVGEKFKKSTILAYDPNHFKGSDVLGDVVATTGVLARVAFMSTGETYEDSMFINSKLAHDATTFISKECTKIISRFSTIHKIVKIGDVVRAGDPFIVFDDTGDEETSEMSRINREQREIFDQLSNTAFTSEVAGKIMDVKVYYGIDDSLLSDSIKKVAKSIQSETTKRKKVLQKYNLHNDSNTLISPDGKSAMDNVGRIKGIKVEDNVLFEFIIEYEDIISSGDKMTNNSAVKGIVSHVIPVELSGYPLSQPDFKVDAYISQNGVTKRMAFDISKLAVANKIVIDRTKVQMKSKYGAAVKAALGKKASSK